MPSSDRKKFSNPKKNLGVSVKRKSSTSPSVFKSPTPKKKIQRNSTTIETHLRSYNLRNSDLSNPVPDHVVLKFDSPSIKPKDKKQLVGSVKKDSSRCLWCSHFIPADSTDFICFSCHFKDSESRAYYGSRRPRSITRRSSDEPEVIAIVPASPQQKDVIRRNRRNRRPPQKYTPPSTNGKQTANGRQRVNGEPSPNGKASVPLTVIASNLTSGDAKPVKVKMASKADGNRRQSVKGEESPNGKQFANGKLITNGEVCVPLTDVESKLTSGAAKPVKVNMASKGRKLTLSNLISGVAKPMKKPVKVNMASKGRKRKRIKFSTPRSSKWAKFVAEDTPDGSDSNKILTGPNMLYKSPTPKKKIQRNSTTIKNNLRSYNLRNSQLSKPVPCNETPDLDSPAIISKHHKQLESSAKKAFKRCLWCSIFIPADSGSCICFNCQFEDSGVQGIQRSLFQATEAMPKKRRSTDSSDNHVDVSSLNTHVERSSSDNYVEEARTEDKKKKDESPAVKRKRGMYECDRCGKSFTQHQQFCVHNCSCREMVSVEEDSESTLSNYSVTGFAVHLEENPVLNGSDRVEDIVNVGSRLDNVPSESREMSLESADALPAQGKVGEHNAPFHEITTNEESFCLPDTQDSFNTAETISEETVCFDVIETFLEVTTSSLDKKETSLETNEQHSNSTDLCLDAIEPSADSNDPSLDVDESSLGDIQPSFASSEKSSECTLDGTEQSSDSSEASVNATEHSLDPNQHPLDVIESPLDNTESILNRTDVSLNAIELSSGPTKASLDANEPTLDAKDTTLDSNEPTPDANQPTLYTNEPTSDANEPPLDANELFLNVTNTSLNNTQPAESSCSSAAENSLDAIEPSLDTSGSCLYLEESFLDPEVSNLGATVQISDTNDNNVVEHCLGIEELSLNATEPSADITGLPSLDAPSLDTNESYSVQNPIAAPLNVIEDSKDSCTVVAKSDLNTTKLHLDASKTELAVDDKNKTQINLEGLEASLQLQNCHLEGRWNTCFKEPGPSLEKLATSSKVQESSLQVRKAFFKGACSSKNMESSVECTSSLHDSKINLEEFKETQVILQDQKSSVDVGSAAAKSESNENKTSLKEAEAIVKRSLTMDSNLGREKWVSKVTELNLEQKSSNFIGQESSLNVEECTLKQKEYCVAGVESQDQIEEIDISQDNFCIQITNVCSVLDNSKVEPEAKGNISPCSVSKPLTNDYKADSPCHNNNTPRSETLSRQVSPPPKWENSGLRKGKRKPEDSIKGKEPKRSHSLPSSSNKSLNSSGIPTCQPLPLNRNLDSNGMSQRCHACGEPLSFPTPLNSRTKAEVLGSNLSFSSETTCWSCSADQKIQFSLPTKTLDSMFSYHMSSFIGRMDRMSHKNFKQVPFHLLASVQQEDASSDLASQTLNSTCSDSSSNADSQRAPSCTYPSCTPPPSPHSCPGSVAAQEIVQEEVQLVQEDAQEVLPPREIELTEHNFPDELDLAKKRSEDTYTCTRFESTSCLLPLRKTDIYLHFFNVHHSPADKTTFSVLHVDE